jgi:hypothetical protein
LERVIFNSSFQRERVFAEADGRREGRRPLRLQAKKNAGRFKNRRFPLPVLPHDKIEARFKLHAQRFEAAKISELKFRQHID